MLRVNEDALEAALPDPVAEEIKEAFPEHQEPPDEDQLEQSAATATNAFDSICGLFEPVGEGEDQPSLGVVLVTMLDLMTKHKATDAIMKDFVGFLHGFVPEGGENMPTFYMLQSLLKRHMEGTVEGDVKAVEKIEICVNTCIAFRDSNLPARAGQEQMHHAHRSYCHLCGENRYLDDRRTPRRIYYFLPCAIYFQDLFMRPDLVDHLRNNTSPQMFPSGHLRRSVGWCQKVLDNPNINDDPRHQAVHLASDGVPLFGDKHFKNGEAIVMRSANLPDYLNIRPEMCHLSCFVEGKYKSQSDDGTVQISIKYIVSIARCCLYICTLLENWHIIVHDIYAYVSVCLQWT
jgi:hypothetical protein